MATNTVTTRRALVTALVTAPIAAATPALVAQAAHLDGGLSPRLAELKDQFEAAYATEQSLRVPEPVDDDAEWNEAWETMAEIAFVIMGEPVHSKADFAFKASVWDRACNSADSSWDDAMVSRWGWMDRAPLRLLNDVRTLLAATARV